MNQLIEFINNVIHYYPPEWVCLYLLLGLGVALAKLSSVKIDWRKNPAISIFIGIPFGVFTGIIVILLWPVYFTATIFHRIAK